MKCYGRAGYISGVLSRCSSGRGPRRTVHRQRNNDRVRRDTGKKKVPTIALGDSGPDLVIHRAGQARVVHPDNREGVYVTGDIKREVVVDQTDKGPKGIVSCRHRRYAVSVTAEKLCLSCMHEAERD